MKTKWMMFALAIALPRDAYVTSFVGASDSMTLELYAADAAAALEGVRAIPGVASVRMLAPVRREPLPHGGIADQLQVAAHFAEAALVTR